MPAPSEPNLTHLASRHARRVQRNIAAATVVFTFLAQLLIFAAAESTPLLGQYEDEALCVVFVGQMTLISVYASWSSVWIMLGCGRWMTRLAITLGFIHVAVLLGLGIAFGVEAIRDLDSNNLRWRDALAAFSAFSYAFTGQILVYSFFIWLLKIFRFRLLYFASADRYPHPRATGRQIAVPDRPGTVVLSGRVYLADIFVLTTLIAVYLGGWYPIVEIALQDGQIFGASFLFLVVLVFVGCSAAIALLVVLLPGVLAMLDRRGPSFQIVLHSIVLIVGGGELVRLSASQVIEDEAVLMAAAGVVAFLIYEGSLYFAMRKPTKWFRFRLVRAA